jgi:hypothetical protein
MSFIYIFSRDISVHLGRHMRCELCRTPCSQNSSTTQDKNSPTQHVAHHKSIISQAHQQCSNQPYLHCHHSLAGCSTTVLWHSMECQGDCGKRGSLQQQQRKENEVYRDSGQLVHQGLDDRNRVNSGIRGFTRGWTRVLFT